MEDEVVWRTKSLSVYILLYPLHRSNIMLDIQPPRIEDGLIMCATPWKRHSKRNHVWCDTRNEYSTPWILTSYLVTSEHMSHS